jgi:hypothetical protein
VADPHCQAAQQKPRGDGRPHPLGDGHRRRARGREADPPSRPPPPHRNESTITTSQGGLP